MDNLSADQRAATNIQFLNFMLAEEYVLIFYRDRPQFGLNE